MKTNSRDVRSLSVFRWLRNNKNWFAPILPYFAVWAGLFLFKNAWFTLIGFHIAIAFVLLVVQPNIPISILFKSKTIGSSRRPRRRFASKPCAEDGAGSKLHKYPKWVVASMLLCGSSGFGLYFLWGIFGIANDLPAQLQSIGLTSSSWPVFIAYFALVNPFVEEYFWRAYLGSATKGFYIGDLVYAGYHGLILMNKVHPISIFFALTCLTFIGWFWRQIVREDGGLLAPILGHMAADFTILWTIYLMTR